MLITVRICKECQIESKINHWKQLIGGLVKQILKWAHSAPHNTCRIYGLNVLLSVSKNQISFSEATNYRQDATKTEHTALPVMRSRHTKGSLGEISETL